RQQDRVFVVESAPRHERNKHVLAQRQFAIVGTRTVRQNLTATNALPFVDDWTLRNARRLVRAEHIEKPIGIAAAVFSIHNDLLGRDPRYRSGPTGNYDGA